MRSKSCRCPLLVSLPWQELTCWSSPAHKTQCQAPPLGADIQQGISCTAHPLVVIPAAQTA